MAVWNISPKYYDKQFRIIQDSLLEEHTINKAFNECRDFCYQYISHIPKEYNYDPLVDLLTAWGAKNLLSRNSKRYRNLPPLRDTCSYIINQFSAWWGL